MRNIILIMTAIFVINLVGIYFKWYDFFWFDMVLHFSGGLFVALLFSKYLERHLFSQTKLANMLIIIGATMMIGVVWEFGEYFMNQTFSAKASAAFGMKLDFIGNLDDTMSDLLMDMLGAILTAAAFLKLKPKN